MNPYSESIGQAASILNAAILSIKEHLSHPDLKQLCDITCNRVGQIEKNLYGLAGLPQSGTIAVDVAQFEPLTKVMGIPVNSRKPVDETVLQPTLTERDLLRNRIDAFYDQIPSMSNEKVLEVLREPSGTSILRGAAKKAKVDNWREGVLDVLFVQEIKERITWLKEIESATSTADDISQSGESKAWGKELPEGLKESSLSGVAAAGLDGEAPKSLNQIKDLVKDAVSNSPDFKILDSTKVDTTAANVDTSKVDTTNANGAVADPSLVEKVKALKEAGRTHKEIAEELQIAVGTVSNYLKR